MPVINLRTLVSYAGASGFVNAVAAAIANDILEADDSGNYTAPASMPATNNLTLRSIVGQRATLTGGFRLQRPTFVSNLIIRDGASSIFCNTTYTGFSYVDNCTIGPPTSSGRAVVASTGLTASDIVYFTNCTIKGYSKTSGTSMGVYSAGTVGYGNVVIDRCTVENALDGIRNTIRGIYATVVQNCTRGLTDLGRAGASYLTRGEGITVAGCTTGIYTKFSAYSPVGQSILNNVALANCTTGVFVDNDADANNFDYFLWYNCGTKQTGGMAALTHEWEATTGTAYDPKFVVNYTNLHLQSSTPIKDLGVTSVYYTKDRDGVDLPVGAGYPLGAYELNWFKTRWAYTLNVDTLVGNLPVVGNTVTVNGNDYTVYDDSDSFTWDDWFVELVARRPEYKRHYPGNHRIYVYIGTNTPPADGANWSASNGSSGTLIATVGQGYDVNYPILSTLPLNWYTDFTTAFADLYLALPDANSRAHIIEVGDEVNYSYAFDFNTLAKDLVCIGLRGWNTLTLAKYIGFTVTGVAVNFRSAAAVKGFCRIERVMVRPSTAGGVSGIEMTSTDDSKPNLIWSIGQNCTNMTSCGSAFKLIGAGSLIRDRISSTTNPPNLTYVFDLGGAGDALGIWYSSCTAATGLKLRATSGETRVCACPLESTVKEIESLDAGLKVVVVNSQFIHSGNTVPFDIRNNQSAMVRCIIDASNPAWKPDLFTTQTALLFFGGNIILNHTQNNDSLVVDGIGNWYEDCVIEAGWDMTGSFEGDAKLSAYLLPNLWSPIWGSINNAPDVTAYVTEDIDGNPIPYPVTGTFSFGWLEEPWYEPTWYRLNTDIDDKYKLPVIGEVLTLSNGLTGVVYDVETLPDIIEFWIEKDYINRKVLFNSRYRVYVYSSTGRIYGNIEGLTWITPSGSSGTIVASDGFDYVFTIISGGGGNFTTFSDAVAHAIANIEDDGLNNRWAIYEIADNSSYDAGVQLIDFAASEITRCCIRNRVGCTGRINPPVSANGIISTNALSGFFAMEHVRLYGQNAASQSQFRVNGKPGLLWDIYVDSTNNPNIATELALTSRNAVLVIASNFPLPRVGLASVKTIDIIDNGSVDGEGATLLDNEIDSQEYAIAITNPTVGPNIIANTIEITSVNKLKSFILAIGTMNGFMLLSNLIKCSSSGLNASLFDMTGVLNETIHLLLNTIVIDGVNITEIVDTSQLTTHIGGNIIINRSLVNTPVMKVAGVLNHQRNLITANIGDAGLYDTSKDLVRDIKTKNDKLTNVKYLSACPQIRIANDILNVSKELIKRTRKDGLRIFGAYLKGDNEK